MDVYEIWDEINDKEFDLVEENIKKFLLTNNEEDIIKLITSLIYSILEGDESLGAAEVLKDIAEKFNNDYEYGSAFVILHHPYRTSWSGELPKGMKLVYESKENE